MLKTPIYIVSVTTIKFHKSETYPSYSLDKCFYHIHKEVISSIHLSHDDAERQKDTLVQQCQQKGTPVFSAIIDEYFDGSITSEELPHQRFVYERNGRLVEILNLHNGRLISSSEIPTYSKGHIVEILTVDNTLQLGIILETPKTLSGESKDSILCEEHYLILTGPYFDDVNYYGLSQLRSYKGDPEDVSFLKELMSRYPNLLPHEE